MGRHSASELAMVYWRGSFWCGVFERAVKTAAQSALGVLGASTFIQDVDWRAMVGTVILATLTSVLTSVGDPDRTDTSVATSGR